MTAFMVWRLVIDLGFLGSVIFFCFKYAKLSTLSQVESVIELEGSLRRLMQEAQASGAQLSDVLVKRQTAIEKLMVDMQAVEQRIKRLATAAELSASQMNRPQPETPLVAPKIEVAAPPLASQIVTEVVTVDTSKIETTIQPTTPISQPELTEEPIVASAAPQKTSKQYNIFGEEISSKPSTSMSQAAPAPRLATKVEREVLPEIAQPKKLAPYEEATSPAKDIQKVYSAAEELLKAGKEVEYVAFRTKLPVGDVQMLATMIEREQEVPPPAPEVAAITEDPRLGVLGSIKRQVQTI